ncbi:MAG: hypothetical protein ACFFC3_03180, partial [Candidatus Odinarchaeota archaeon]
EFVREMNKILINRLPGSLKNEFSNISRISINQRSFNSVLVDLEDLIFYLNDIGEYSWIILFIRNIFSKMQEYDSFGEAVTYIRKFIDFSISRNRFEMAFDIYDFLEDLFMYITDLSYDKVLIELWVEACKKFVEMREKRYLLQSLEKLNNHLKLPQKYDEIFHYFYTCNILWQFKSMFFALEQRDFWRMMFYRAIFEEQNYHIAQKVLTYLDEDFSKIITDLSILYKETEHLHKEIYTIDDKNDISDLFRKDFAIKQLVLRINSKGMISYRMNSINGELIDGKIFDEYWNDSQIFEIYEELFSESEDRKYTFDLNEYGQILYIFLPKLMRNMFKSFKIESLNITPHVYFILENMTIPLDLIYDKNFFCLKYSIGYKISEIPLRGIGFDYMKSEDSSLDSSKMGYNVLVIDSINSKSPLKWNEDKRRKELIFPFQAGIDELNYLINFFNQRSEINQLATLIGHNSTRENIVSNLNSGIYQIIVFVGNIFYSNLSPKNSYFLTNDNQILTFNEINNILSKNSSEIQPFIFFNSQMYDTEGNKIRNALIHFGEIFTQFDYEKIIGIITKNYPIFNEETKKIISIFFFNLFNKNSQGEALLKARQQCIANKMEKVLQEKIKDSNSGIDTTNIDLRSSLAISSYLLFGKPWRKLIS